MRYEKTAHTFEAQADKLLSRGLQAERAELIRRLESVSYYRLSGYWYPLREPESENFRAGATLQTIWRRYCFDRRLRSLLLDAIERIEVSLRTKLIYHFSHEHGAFGYQDDRNFPGLKISEYLEWRTALLEETSRSKEVFKKRFFDKYGDAHKELPVWMLAELMSFGSLLTFYRGIAPEIQKKIAQEYGLADELFLSWIRGLNAARNICAHHARLWNRELGYAVLLPAPNKFPEWHGERRPLNNRTGVLLLICRFFARRVAPSSQWAGRVEALFDEYPDIPVAEMGFRADWRSHPVWAAEETSPQ